MSEDIRWETKAAAEKAGDVRTDILTFYQDTTRLRA